MCERVCVRLCVRWRSSPAATRPVCVCVHEREREDVCVCVSVCGVIDGPLRLHQPELYVCVCVYMV